MGGPKNETAALAPSVLIPRLIDDSQHSQVSDQRAIRQLLACRHNAPDEFLEKWIYFVQPLFMIPEKNAAANRVVDRVMNFAAAFTAHWTEEISKDCEDFFEKFLWTILDWSEARNDTIRLRACQMISESLAKLDQHFTIGERLWDRMISSMQTRMEDRRTSIRKFAASALSRLVQADDIENQGTVQAYRKALATDPSSEVRRMVVKCMPAANATVPDLVERIADVSESVRKAAYQTIGERLCASGLSIKQRATTLERGLAERDPAVRADCEKLLKLWLVKECDNDPLILLRYLDVETYEKVGETVVLELLKKNLITLPQGGLRQFLGNADNQSEGDQIMSVEQALFWRVVCTHIHEETQKGCNDTASSRGAAALVNASAAEERADYFESILPPMVADFVRLVEIHLHRGSACWFAARQLLLLAKLLDFADSASRKEAAALLQRLLTATSPSEENHEGLDNPSSEESIGDGLSLGGEESWARAVAELAQVVHAAPGEFEAVLAASVAEVGRPCREGGADAKQWLHCLAVTGLLLEGVGLQSLRVFRGLAIEPDEMLHSLLMPAVKHLNPEVQRAGVRCLGIFCCMERTPTPRALEQLRMCLQNSSSLVHKMALKAMFDLIICHGAVALDSAVGIQNDLAVETPHPRPPGLQIPHTMATPAPSLHREPLLEILFEALQSEEELVEDGTDGTYYENENYKISIAAEGFAKVLLHNERFPEVRLMQDSVLEELIILFFSDCTNLLPRLKQCLSVFYQIWCSLSLDNKRCIARVFIPVLRKKWPGIYGNDEQAGTVLVARKHATQVAHFMLYLLNLPVRCRPIKTQTRTFASPNGGETTAADTDEAQDGGHEMLAVKLCVEIVSQHRKLKRFSMAGKSYILMLCRCLASLPFSSFRQLNIKAIRSLIARIVDWLPPGEKSLLKSLTEALTCLKELDQNPEACLPDEELELFMVRMGFHDYFSEDSSPEESDTQQASSVLRSGRRVPGPSKKSIAEQTPVPLSSRSLRTRRSAQAQGMPRKNLNSVYVSESSDEQSDSSEPADDSESSDDLISDIDLENEVR